MSSNPTINPPARNSRLRTLLFVLATATTIAILAGFAYCWRMALAAVAPAPSHIGAPPAELPIDAIKLDSESGATIAGWYLPADNARGAILLAHPIRGSRLSMLDRARLFHDAGYATLLIDFRSHGESTGDSITMGHLERHDIRAAVALLKARHSHQPIAVDGWSLGGAAAQDPKQRVFFEDAAHVDLMQFDSVEFSAATLKFLDEHMRPASSPTP